MLTQRTWKSHLFACLAAGGIGLSALGTAQGETCRSCETTRSCETQCNACSTQASTSGCSLCERFGGRQHNCLKKGFGKFTDSIRSLFKSKSGGCDESLCDDACDAAMMDELMVPLAPQQHHHSGVPYHQTPQQGHGRGHSHGALPVVPEKFESIERPAAETPSADFRMSPPTIGVSPGRENDAEAAGRIPPPVAPPEAEEKGSLFDSLNDPFNDDEARSRVDHRVRPSSYVEDSYEEVSLRSTRRLPLSRSHSRSSRRASSNR